MDDDQVDNGRSAETRRRHGEDFYARIGRKSWEVRRRAKAGDVEAQALLQRRRDARANRRAIWQDLLAAQEAVKLLRDELASRARANAEVSRASMREQFRYTDRLRYELQQAETRLAHFQSQHELLLHDLEALPDARG